MPCGSSYIPPATVHISPATVKIRGRGKQKNRRRRFEAKDRNLINNYYYESTLHHLLCHRLHTSHYLLFHCKRNVDMVARRYSRSVSDRGMRMSVSSGERIQQKTIHVDLKGLRGVRRPFSIPIRCSSKCLNRNRLAIEAGLPGRASQVFRYRLS